MSASFSHVKELHQKELGCGVKFAHKLTDKVLAPQPIERSSVKLADAFFHDSTINGLEQCDDEGKWVETANFLKLIRRFWNCVNVQTKSAAMHKRDERRKPITINDKSQLEFLESFVEWLKAWESIGTTNGLSKETFSSAQQTCSALKELAEYLLTVKNLEYVTLGKINSDGIENRFGWYRQLAGTYCVNTSQTILTLGEAQ